MILILLSVLSNGQNIRRTNDMNNKIQTLQTQLTTQANSLKEKDKELTDKTNEIVKKEKIIESQSKEIDDLKKKLATKLERDREVHSYAVSRGGSINNISFLGQFRVSFYTPYDGSATGKTATGVKATPNHTVAVDPRIIPLGTKLYIEGLGEVVAEDTGGAINGTTIDYCVQTKSQAKKLGKKYLKIWVIR